MDYINMMDRITKQCYNKLNIPLPLVEAKSMTMNNYAEAKLVLYDLNILPFATMIAKEESTLLMRRYDKTGDYELSYDPKEIKALQLLRDERNKVKLDSKVLTVNESRALFELDETEGGDVIYQPLNLVPLGFSPVEVVVEDPSKVKFRKELIKIGKLTTEEIEQKVALVYG
jgi:hypothetical protein